MIKAALVIPVHNRRETTLQALRSLARIDRTGLEVRIFVVDDGSTDGTSAAVRKDFPEVELVSGDGSLHYAAGTNRGIQAALDWEPDFIVAMNDDSIFHDQFLQRLVATAKANHRSVVGALLLLWNEPHKVFQVAPQWKTLSGGWQMPQNMTAFDTGETPFAVECIVGNCVLYPVEAIRENGLMDEYRFPHGWGDAQYLMRMRKNGWKLLVDPKALVWCEPNTNPPGLHSVGMAAAFKVLFTDRRHPMNLHRQFVARWESAPSKLLAFPAFAIYCLRLLRKIAIYSLAARQGSTRQE
ncbi:MAG: glycosyltransferase family 2 protein [Acidobacteria bacterium]|nr:glycosyltransferase family 2 protein [Acidobacteriota bacterium]